MSGFFKVLSISLATGVFAAPASLSIRQEALPAQEPAAWDSGAVTQYPIHSSCNATQAHQLALGLNETILLADLAREHILRWGNSSETYQKYFGDLPPYEAIGAYEIIVNGDKGSVLFRCDNPDGNCAIEGTACYGGHWRGSNATDETVICDLSFETRRSLSQMCALGYTVAESKTNTFWASDLMHRLYHIPAIGGEYIGHFTEDHDEVIALAAGDTTESTHDSDTLQYFALEVYAYDVAVPGVGCPGGSTATAVSGAAPTSSSTGSPTVPPSPSTITTAPEECHTHDNGDVHCS